jgi:hypothetical protein
MYMAWQNLLIIYEVVNNQIKEFKWLTMLEAK